jgi:hypothetical protein
LTGLSDELFADSVCMRLKHIRRDGRSQQSDIRITGPNRGALVRLKELNQQTDLEHARAPFELPLPPTFCEHMQIARVIIA